MGGQLTADALDTFFLVGARFSKIIVNEGNLESEQKHAVTIVRGEPSVSKHKYEDRPVIEMVVSVSARPEGDEGDVSSCLFFIECTAGFVGREPLYDGDVEAFGACAAHFGRSVYWMLRERLDSIFAVTTLRAISPLPWDVVAMMPVVDVASSSRPKKKRKTKASSKA